MVPVDKTYNHYHRHHTPLNNTRTHLSQQLFAIERQSENFLNILLERSRGSRDTYDERQKLISTYKVVSKTQCMLQMLNNGTVNAKHVKNLEDSEETQWGVFMFIPVAVNLFLIQSKNSKLYLCGQHNQLFGMINRNEKQCVFESRRSDIDFGRWDSFRLFYEESSKGYISISNICHTRLRKKFDNDNYLQFLAFVRINTDRVQPSLTISSQPDKNKLLLSSRNRNNNNHSKIVINHHHLRFKLPIHTTTTSTSTVITTTPTTTTTTTTTIITTRLMTKQYFHFQRTMYQPYHYPPQYQRPNGSALIVHVDSATTIHTPYRRYIHRRNSTRKNIRLS
ncbi:unnamed protein product [Didymodactylos carnosus]|uniref:Uncharacterized protein n=1 Tax=Didymodactylos carnosus TaxID=1234261 RepID=A0A813X8R3_9BILA|nr:unnamed protein product [Didymodactylos carnosus]CAF0866497.1 unnamed protein product [Didymodactylos carnosus]CAF3605032.1 unnamed protein product [Didymodactylos carnosus]CAF3653980.1 unnamed protein product [Didymodactylos carnosus]